MLLGFKKQFREYVKEGSKRHTIRANRKRPFRVGEICHCYTGLRTKNSELLGRWRCVKVASIRISPGSDPMRVWINDEELSHSEIVLLAFADGFRTETPARSMREFWIHNHGCADFFGVIIHWNYKEHVE